MSHRNLKIQSSTSFLFLAALMLNAQGFFTFEWNGYFHFFPQLEEALIYLLLIQQESLSVKDDQ